jgi:hypothetical protein
LEKCKGIVALINADQEEFRVADKHVSIAGTKVDLCNNTNGWD